MHRLSLWVPLVLAGLFGAQNPTGSRPVDPSGKPAADDAPKDGLGLGKTIWICRVEKPGEEPQDLGAFEVKAGRLVAQSYRRNPGHVLLSNEGFFRHPPELHEQLLKELTARNSKPQEEADKESEKGAR
jgi:hypothetical protein